MVFVLLIRILLGLDPEPLTGKPLAIGIIAVAALVWFTVLMEINSHYGDRAAVYFLLGTAMVLLLRWLCRRNTAKLRVECETVTS
jgi:hypothetical protein